MKKYLITTLSVLSLLIAGETYAQSEVFAGGQIFTEYVGNGAEPCGANLPYDITFQFYRDPGGPAFPIAATKVIGIRDETSPNKALWTTFTVTLDDVTDRPNVPVLCLVGTPVATEGRWYKTSSPVLLDSDKKYRIYYGQDTGPTGLQGIMFQSPENNNIQAGQLFYIDATLNTRCGTITTGPTDSPPNETITFHNGMNNSARWLTQDIVESFCEGVEYRYDISKLIEDNDETTLQIVNTVTGAVTTEKVVDKLNFDLVSVKKADGAAVFYEPGFSAKSPFRTNITDPIIWDAQSGILTFKPSLAVGETNFTAALVFRVSELRKTYKLEPDGAGGMKRVFSEQNINTTFRQMRFVIGNRCNNRLPMFETDNFNQIQQANEFDCADTSLLFRMTEPMFANSLDRLDFRIFRGTPGNTADDNAFAIDSIIPISVNQLGEFRNFRVYLANAIGPGDYTMFTKLGKDGNTLKNRCGFELAEDLPIPIYVNTNYTYKYIFPDGQLTEEFCYPADIPMSLKSLRGQSQKVKDAAARFEFAYRGNQFAPEKFRHISFEEDKYRVDTTFTVPLDFPTTPITDFTDGFWTVGIGLDFSYTYNGTYNSAFCYDEDPNVVINYKVNPPVEIRNLDLCPDEKWPTVSPVIDYTNSSVGLSNVTWRLNDPSYDKNYPYRPIGGQSNSLGTNDMLDLGGVAFGVGFRFDIRSVIEFDNGCVDSIDFSVTKQEVDVEIGNDSTICPGEEYLLMNTTDDGYLSPDLITYEWYFDDQLVPEADSNSIMVDKRGEYKLVVVKTTDNTTCMGVDSVFINVADSLYAPSPICSGVTFKDGSIEQSFYWPVVVGADDYQARGIDQDGDFVDENGVKNPDGDWYKANDLYGINHKNKGAQVRLEVRGVNYEVPENSPCRFGPSAIAEACEVVVKEVNVFSPNGDGINDLLRFDLIEIYPGSKLQIYNRWGRLIYETDSYQNDWDGDDHKEGVYYYVLDINDPENKQDIFKGTFTLVR